MKKIIGIDYGTKYMGIAISDALGILAHAHASLEMRKLTEAEVFSYLAELVKKEDVNKIVLGLPKRTDGKASKMAEQVKDFGSRLEEELGIELVYVNEFYTTVIAHRQMNKSEVKAKKKAKLVDQVAATVILQGYLDSRS